MSRLIGKEDSCHVLESFSPIGCAVGGDKDRGGK